MEKESLSCPDTFSTKKNIKNIIYNIARKKNWLYISYSINTLDYDNIIIDDFKNWSIKKSIGTFKVNNFKKGNCVK